jgi:hypothetical protein
MLTLKPSPSLRPGSAGSSPEDFPTRQQLIHAVSLATLMALVGFVLSYSLFVHPISDLHFHRIDRKRAEEAPPLAYSQSPGVAWEGGGGYAGGLGSMPDPERGPNLDLMVPDVATETPAQTPTPTPTPTVTATALPVDNPDSVPQFGATHHTHPSSATHPSATGSATPAAVSSTARHPVVSQEESWKIASPSLFQMMDNEGPVGGGAVIDPTGLAITCLSSLHPDGLSRIQLGSLSLSATVLARDPEHDIALLQLTPGTYPVLALDQEPPHARELLSIPAGTDPSHFQDARVVTASSRDYLRFRGVQSEAANGVAMINDRGELAGITLGRPLGYPGSNFGIGIDAATIKALLDARKDIASSPRPVSSRLADLLGDAVPTLTQRTPPSQSNGKLVAGEAMGNYPLGMTMAMLTAEMGSGSTVFEKDGFTTVDFPTPRLRCTLVKGRVVAIETDYGFYSTPGGLSAGAPADLNRLRSEVPEAVFGDIKPGTGVASGIGIEVEANGGKVARLRLVPR